MIHFMHPSRAHSVSLRDDAPTGVGRISLGAGPTVRNTNGGQTMSTPTPEDPQQDPDATND
ncbi:MAG: hypothetical protein L0H32_11185, partial [Micrococcaceae bacterium]|nr:hypothetical protein [Micrococcaceae bacterium]